MCVSDGMDVHGSWCSSDCVIVLWSSGWMDLFSVQHLLVVTIVVVVVAAPAPAAGQIQSKTQTVVKMNRKCYSFALITLLVFIVFPHFHFLGRWFSQHLLGRRE